MPRRAASCLLAGLLAAVTLVLPAVPAAAAEGDPLRVTIDRLAPSVIPQRGPLVVSGRITNTTDQVWSDLKVYLHTSFTPFTTEAELLEATATDPTSYIGDRLAEPGQFQALTTTLAPGDSVRYRLRLPRGQLNIADEPGVYWVGVQVLGAQEGERLDGADGRARTLVPLMRPNGPRSTSLALTLPFRARIFYDRDGKAQLTSVWHRALSDRGRFGRLLELARSAGSYPLTLVVDPALLDLARTLAADNPGYSLAPTTEPAETPSPSATATDEPEEPTDPEEPVEQSPEAAEVERWLRSFLDEAGRRDVLSLPYGDVDVAAAFTASYGEVVESSLGLTTRSLEALGLRATPVVDPPDGALPWPALDGLDDAVPVLLNDRAVLAAGPSVDVQSGPSLTVTDSSADDGIPGLEEPTNALAMRQRILAEAALHALSPDRDQPLFVQLPNRWEPGRAWERSDFFEGLDQPWLIPANAGALVRSRPADSLLLQDSEDLVYDDQTPAIPAANFVAANNLVRAGLTLDVLLPENDTIAEQLAGLAYLGTSAQHRDEPVAAGERTKAIALAVGDLMEEVTVSGPAFVTMSSEDGPFQVTIRNGLDQPVTVAVRANAIGTDRLRIPSPEPITLEPGQRHPFRMHANSSTVGIWPVVLQPVNVDGTPLGASIEMKVRSSHVGQFIWGVLGGGTLLLFVLIVFRVRRKVRARQSTHGPLLKADA